jgi:hypothetical protein
MAPCACQKAQPSVWTYVSKDGTVTHDYPSEIQARAAVVRNNGGKVVAKAT